MIKEIKLENFGRLSGRSFEFAPFTVIRGNNESGKTTLFDALFDNVCGEGGRGAVWTRLRDRYGAKRASALVYKEGTEPYKIPAPEFLGIYGVRAGAIHLEADESGSWIELARSSLFSGGLDPARLAGELARRNDYSGNVGHNNEIKTLNAELAASREKLRALEINRERILSGGEEERLGARLADLDAGLEEKNNEVKKARAGVKTLAAAMEKAAAQEELEFLEQCFSGEEKLAKLASYKEEKLAEYDALKEEAAAFEREIESLRGGRKALEEQAAALSADLGGRGAGLAAAQKSAETASLLLGRIAGFSPACAPEAYRPLRGIIWAAGLLLAAAVFYILRENTGAALFVSLCLLAGCGGAGYFMVAGGPAGAEKRFMAALADEWKNAGLNPEAIRRETLAGAQEALLQEKAAFKRAAGDIEGLKAGLRGVEEKIKSGGADLKELSSKKEAAGARAGAWLEKAGCAARDEYHSRVVEAATRRNESAVTKAKLKALLEARQADSPENLKIRLRLLVNEHGAESGAAGADRKALEAARAALETALKAQERLALDRASAWAELEGLRGRAAGGLKGLPENIQAEHGRITATQARIQANRLEGSASAAAAGIFAEMARESSLALAGLAGEIRALLEEALPGAGVEISGLCLDCVKVNDAAGALRPIDQVSSGTRDCFMLAARLALARKARSGKPGLLVLDEPFYAVDAPRRAAALELLKKFQSEAGWQVILLTKDGDLASAAASSFSGEPGFRLIELA